MNSRESAALDRHITGNYGEDQFRVSSPLSYRQRRDSFLDSLTTDLIELGHDPFRWTKGAHGFHTYCRKCGTVFSCLVSQLKKKNFPADQCRGNGEKSV